MRKFQLIFFQKSAYQCLILFLLLTINFCAYGQNFTKAPGTHPALPVITDTRTLLVMDLDNNSYPDIIFANRNTANHEYYRVYRDTVLPAPSGNGISNLRMLTAGVTGGDLNADCYPDLYLTNGSGGSGAQNLINVYLENDGEGNFTSNTNAGAASVIATSSSSSLSDISGNGALDIYTANSGSNKPEYYENNGNNSFNRIDTLPISNQNLNARTPAWCDFDNDGDLDLFLAVVGGNNRLFRNDSGSFTEITTGNIANDGGNSFTISWGDYDGDGLMDVVVGNSISSSPVWLYRNQGQGNFTKVTTGIWSNLQGKFSNSFWFDANNDGHLDLFLGGAHGTANSLRENRLLINQGNGNFQSVSSGPLVNDRSNNTSCAVADIDRDGDLDILIAIRNGRNEIYLNDHNSKDFVSLNLLGTQGKAQGINAKVRYKCNFGSGSRWEYRRSMVTKGNSAGSSPVVHLGTGQATVIDSLEIEWLGGTTCVFTNVPVGEFYNVDPSGCRMDAALHAEINDSLLYRSAQFGSDSSRGDILRYHWDFGDGDTSDLPNPHHRYSNPGTYTVSLTIYDSYCKWDSVQTIIEVCPDTGQLGFFKQTNGRSLNFTDTSRSNGYLYLWDFGDGQTDTGRTVNNHYSTTGQYNVCLTVVDSCRSKQLCRQVFVCEDTLLAQFGYQANVLTLNFSDSSKNANSWHWSFGDGQTDTSQNPSHQYSSRGYYVVCLTIADSCTSSTTCDTVGVCVDTAQAGFSYSVNNQVVQFQSQAQNATTQHQWDFGDGNFSSQINPTHLYQSFGTYEVCLAVSNGCSADTLCKELIICQDSAQAGFSYHSLQSPLFIQFTDQSQDAVSYFWDFGDNSSSTNRNPVKVYNTSGTYEVCLSVTDTCGQQDSICQTLGLYIGVEEWQALQELRVYPNPTTDRLWVEQNLRQGQDMSLQLRDTQGRLLLQSKMSAREERRALSLETLAPGVYLLEVSNSAGQNTWRVVKE